MVFKVHTSSIHKLLIDWQNVTEPHKGTRSDILILLQGKCVIRDGVFWTCKSIFSHIHLIYPIKKVKLIINNFQEFKLTFGWIFL